MLKLRGRWSEALVENDALSTVVLVIHLCVYFSDTISY